MGSQLPIDTRWILIAVLGLGLLSIPLLGGVSVAEAQENESNESEDDGFGAEPDGSSNISIDYGGGDSEDVVVEDTGEEENSSNENASEVDDGGSGFSPIEDAKNARNAVLDRGRDVAEEHVPGAERLGNIYDTAKAAEETITGGADAVHSPGEWAHSVAVYFTTAALNELIALINALHAYAIQVPAPGEATDPSTWTEPESGFWQTVYSVMSWPLVLGIMWLITQFGISFSYDSAEKRRRSWKRVGFAGLMIFGTFVFFPGLLHLFAELAQEIYPDGEQFISVDGAVRFGLGVIVLAVLVFFKGIIVIAALVAIIAMNFLTYVVGLFWPLMWAAWASHGQARAYGSFGLFIFGGLLALSIIQSIILRFLIFLPLGESVAGTAGSIVLIAFGVGFALAYLPWKFLQKAQLAASIKMGREPTEKALDRTVHRAPGEVKRIASDFYDRGSGEQTTLDQYSTGSGWTSGIRDRFGRSSGGSSTDSGGSGDGGSPTSTTGDGGGSSSRSGSSDGSTGQSVETSNTNQNSVDPIDADYEHQTFDEMEKERIDRILNS